MGQNLRETDDEIRVAIRRLAVTLPGAEPDAATPVLPVESLSGRIRERGGSRLQVQLDPLIAAHSVEAGDLIEIRTHDTAFLGQVRAVRGLALSIALEHALDLSALEAIRRVWDRPVNPPATPGAHPEAPHESLKQVRL